MILVVGGAGYIGSHCVLALQDAGFEVIIFDRKVALPVECNAYVQGDLQVLEEIEAVFKKYKIDAVVHFAANIEVGESVVDPQKYYYNNVYGTLNLLNAMKQNSVDKIVFSSTAAVYGEPQYTPIDENHPKIHTNSATSRSP